MSRINRGAQRAGRLDANGIARIGATSRAGRDQVAGVQLDVRGQVRAHGDRGTRGLAFFQRELVGRRVKLAEVVDASVGLRGGTRFHEVRDRNRREEADDGHNDHDFDEREARAADVFIGFHLLFFL